MQIPHQPIILNRIKELNTNPKIIGRHLGLSERQSYRIVKSYKKKDQAAVSYVLDQIEKELAKLMAQVRKAEKEHNNKGDKMDKKEFVVQSVVDGKVTGQCVVTNITGAFGSRDGMVAGIEAAIKREALVVKKRAYVEIIEVSRRNRREIKVMQPVSDIQHLLDEIKADAVELRRVTGLYKSMVKMKEEVMAELEDMKIERDTYRDNLKVLRGEHMGLDKANLTIERLEKDLKETMHQSDWYRDGWVEATNNYKELYASMQKGFDLVEKELEGVQVVLTGVRMAGMTTNS